MLSGLLFSLLEFVSVLWGKLNKTHFQKKSYIVTSSSLIMLLSEASLGLVSGSTSATLMRTSGLRSATSSGASEATSGGDSREGLESSVLESEGSNSSESIHVHDASLHSSSSSGIKIFVSLFSGLM